MSRLAQLFLAAGITLFVNLVVWFVSFNLVGVTFERSLPSTLNNLMSVILFGIGLGQFLYLLPAAAYLIWRRRFLWLQGMTLGAVLTLFLNGGCWVLIASGR
ncbi:MAG: hypothetical protein AAFR42_09025 [Cyanobacteria bacterium J06628_6]